MSTLTATAQQLLAGNFAGSKQAAIKQQPISSGQSAAQKLLASNFAGSAQAIQKAYWPSPYHSLSGWTYGQVEDSGKVHPGWDVTAPANSPVFAPVSGIVVKTVPMDPYGWGNAIRIDTPDGHQLYFAHLNSFLVRPGQIVSAGQEIALSGNTFTPGVGFSSAPHLHFEVRDSSGQPVDPDVLFAGSTVENATPGYTPDLASPARGADRQTVPSGTSKSTTAAAPGSASPAKQAAAAQTGSSDETAFVQWNLVDSPVLGKMTFKLTPKIVALVLGSILLVLGFGLSGVEGFSGLWKKNYDFSKQLAGDMLATGTKGAKAAKSIAA